MKYFFILLITACFAIANEQDVHTANRRLNIGVGPNICFYANTTGMSYGGTVLINVMNAHYLKADYQRIFRSTTLYYDRLYPYNDVYPVNYAFEDVGLSIQYMFDFISAKNIALGIAAGPQFYTANILFEEDYDAEYAVQDENISYLKLGIFFKHDFLKCISLVSSLDILYPIKKHSKIEKYNKTYYNLNALSLVFSLPILR